MRNLYWGFILIVIGIMLLLDNLGVADFEDIIRDYWPLLLVFWGLGLLLRRRSGPHSQPSAGSSQSEPSHMGSSETGFSGTGSPQAGSSQMGSSQGAWSQGGSSQGESELLHQSSAFGDIAVNVTSPHFRGGSVSTIFGASNLDLSAAGIAEGEHELRIHGVFGDSRLVLPKDAAVAISANSVFGNLVIFGQHKGGISSEIQHVTPNYPAAPSRLKITITKVFGNIKVE